MQVRLIHNASAGSSAQHGVDALLDLIRGAGHEAVYHPTREDDLPRILAEPTQLIAVAGGDGTIGTVARHMSGRGIPLAVLPLGTANNISRTLGVMDVPIEEHAAGWHGWRSMKFDVGVARGPWGTRKFIEGVGAGLFAWTMPDANEDETLKELTEREDKVAYAARMVKNRIEQVHPIEIKARLDGTDISGEYILFEAMNINYIGPNLYLAPDNDPGDGLLDIVLVTEDERDKLYRYVASWEKGRMQRPNLKSLRGRRLEMEWTGFDVHIDDKAWPTPEDDRPDAPAMIEVSIESDVLEFLSPD